MPQTQEIVAAREKVRAWVADTAWSRVEEVRNEQVHWAFRCSMPPGNQPLPLTVAQSANRDDVVELSFDLVSHPDEMDRLRRLPLARKRALSAAIFVALAPTSIGQRYETDEHEVPVRQILYHRIAYDGLTKDRFLNAVQALHNALTTVVAIQHSYLASVPEVTH